MPFNPSVLNIPTVIVNVAVAVIYYQERYLLGFRHPAQHQGNRYEFIGGKIETDENPISALIREVGEETGIDISSVTDSYHDSQNHANTAVKLGRLYHDYGDKQVCLQVYKVALTDTQYDDYQYCKIGLEGQALKWVSQDKLLSGIYSLPAANRTILSWLSLPNQITITYPIAHFNEQTNMNSQKSWFKYHINHLPVAEWVYIRPKEENSAALVEQLIRARPDIQTLLPMRLLAINPSSIHPLPHIKALHLTHTEVMTWFNNSQRDAHRCKVKLCNHSHDRLFSAYYPLIISCHDTQSIHAANQLAASRIEQQLPPVIAIFLSPVMITQTHPNDSPLGWDKWSSLAQLADMPVIALGGLSPNTKTTAAQYGAMSVAGIRQFHAH